MSGIKVPWKTVSSKVVYKNPWIKVIEDLVVRPDGSDGLYSVVETRGSSVFVVALTEKDEVYLIGLDRYTTKQFSWELPAGNAEKQDPLVAAKRELQEETGLVATEWIEAGKHHSMNGISDELSYVFIAKKLKKTKKEEMNEEGITRVKKVHLKAAFAMIENGELVDGQSISALFQAVLRLGLLV